MKLKKGQKIEDLEYVRTLKAYKPDTSFMTQAYCDGIYVIINNDPSLQMGITHKEFPKWVKGSVKKMENNGLRVEITKSPYINFLSEDEIKKICFNRIIYENKKRNIP